uniref:F-box domain-containing protein n=1 Tax=Bionectria ochroleuca TaxID=29856 RepID=A0A8H7TTD1_BIOOC
MEQARGSFSSKSLRQASSFFAETVKIRISRVFLSANPQNIDVIEAIANHETRRHHVEQLIWDDSLLAAPDNLWEMRSISYYKELCDEQEDIISAGEDIRAFRTALYRFPNLKKVTVTPVCHGFLFTPLYETPMIRDFPKGFNYPIPRSWPSYVGRAGYLNVNRWPSFHEASKVTWNAVRVVLKDLALHQNRVTELEINVHGLDYGVPVDMFHSRNAESMYFNTVASNLRRLDLSIEVPTSRTGNPLEEISQSICQALDHSPYLHHFSLHCNRQGYDRRFPPLRTLFPVDNWKWLQHFGLTGFKVDIDDLVDFLSSMPATLSSLELGFLRFQRGAGRKTYYDLMQAMRNKLGWSTRSEDDRPKIVIRVEVVDPVPGRYNTADKEVEDFIRVWFFHHQLYKKGITHDEFDSAYERPNLANEELVALGILKDARDIEDLPYNVDDQDDYDYDSQDESSEEDDDYEWSDSAASE